MVNVYASYLNDVVLLKPPVKTYKLSFNHSNAFVCLLVVIVQSLHINQLWIPG